MHHRIGGYKFIITNAFNKIFTGRCVSKRKRQRKKLDKRGQWRAEDLPIMFDRVNSTYILSAKQYAEILRQQSQDNLEHNLSYFGF